MESKEALVPFDNSLWEEIINEYGIPDPLVTSSPLTLSVAKPTLPMQSTTVVPEQPKVVETTREKKIEVKTPEEGSPAPLGGWEQQSDFMKLTPPERLTWFDELIEDLRIQTPVRVRNYLLSGKLISQIDQLLMDLYLQSNDEKQMEHLVESISVTVPKIEAILDSNVPLVKKITPTNLRSQRRALVSARMEKAKRELTLPKRFQPMIYDESDLKLTMMDAIADSDLIFTQAMYFSLGQSTMRSWGELFESLRDKDRKTQLKERQSWSKMGSMFAMIDLHTLGLPVDAEAEIKVIQHNEFEIAELLEKNGINVLGEEDRIPLPVMSFNRSDVKNVVVPIITKEGTENLTCPAVLIKNGEWVHETTVRAYKYQSTAYPADTEARNALLRLLKVFYVRSMDTELSPALRQKSNMTLVKLKHLWLIRNYVVANYYYGKRDVADTILRLSAVQDVHERMKQSNPEYLNDQKVMHKMQQIVASGGRVPRSLEKKQNALVTGSPPNFQGYLLWRTRVSKMFPMNTRFPYYLLSSDVIGQDESFKNPAMRTVKGRPWVSIPKTMIQVNKEAEAGPLYNGNLSARRVNKLGQNYGAVTRGDVVSILCDRSMPMFVFERLKRKDRNQARDLASMFLYNLKGKPEPYLINKHMTRNIFVYSGCYGNINAFFFGCAYRDAPMFLFHPHSRNLIGFSLAHGGADRLITVLLNMDVNFGVTYMIVHYCDNFYLAWIKVVDETRHLYIASFDGSKMEGSFNIHAATYEIYRMYEDVFKGKVFIDDNDVRTIAKAIESLDSHIALRVRTTASWADAESDVEGLTIQDIKDGEFESKKKDEIINLVERLTDSTKNSFVSSEWATYIADYMPSTISNAVAQLSSFQIMIEYLVSGSQGTAFMNAALMTYGVDVLQKEVNEQVLEELEASVSVRQDNVNADPLRGGDGKHSQEELEVPEAISHALSRAGIIIKLESVVELSPKPGRFPVDWLGFDFVYFEYGNLSTFLPVLSLDRMHKSTWMKKYSERIDKLDENERYGRILLNFITYNSKYLVGGWYEYEMALLYTAMTATAAADLNVKGKARLAKESIEGFVADVLGEVGIKNDIIQEDLVNSAMSGLVYSMADVIRIFGRPARVNVLVDGLICDFISHTDLIRYYDQTRVPARFRLPRPGKSGWVRYKPTEVGKYQLDWEAAGGEIKIDKIIEIPCAEGQFLKKGETILIYQAGENSIRVAAPSDGRISHIGYTAGFMCCFEPLPDDGRVTFMRPFSFSDEITIRKLVSMYLYETRPIELSRVKYEFINSDYEAFKAEVQQRAPEDYANMFENEGRFKLPEVVKAQPVLSMPGESFAMPFSAPTEMKTAIKPPVLKERSQAKAVVMSKAITFDPAVLKAVKEEMSKLDGKLFEIRSWPKSFTTEFFTPAGKLSFTKERTAVVRNLLRRALVYDLGGNKLIYDQLTKLSRADNKAKFYPDVTLVIKNPLQGAKTSIVVKVEDLTRELIQMSQKKPKVQKVRETEGARGREVNRSKLLWRRKTKGQTKTVMS